MDDRTDELLTERFGPETPTEKEVRSEMFIESERLIITEFTMDMAAVVQENSVDEDNRESVPDEVWNTVEETEENLSLLISQYGSFEGPLVYPIIVKDTQENVGYVQLCPIEDGQWEVGYHVAKKFRFLIGRPLSEYILNLWFNDKLYAR